MKHLYKFPTLLMLYLLAACSTIPKEPAPSNTFNDASMGFSITKPSGWNYVSQQSLEANRNTNRRNNSELKKVSQENGDSPFLVVFSRYPEPNPKNNPTVSVTVVNLGREGLPPKGIMTWSTAAMKKAYPDLDVVEEIRAQEVDGIMGAYTRLKFTVSGADGQKLRTMHRMWLIPRGTLMFAIAMTGPQEGPDVSDEAFQEILNSVKITR
jgi:hypothetical protein